MRAVSKPQKKPTSEEVLLHGDSINFTAARVSDKPGRIRITSAHIEDYKTVLSVAAVAHGLRIDSRILLRDRLPLEREAVMPSIPFPPRSPRPRSAPLEAETYSAAPSPVAAVWRRVHA